MKKTDWQRCKEVDPEGLKQARGGATGGSTGSGGSTTGQPPD